jgi:diguanylate cyclase (GGDEF)-like protein
LRISLALLCACAAAGLLTWVLLTSAKAEDGEATNIWPTVLGALAQHELEEELIPREFTPWPEDAFKQGDRQLRLLAWISPEGEPVVLRRRSALDLESLLSAEDAKLTSITTRSDVHPVNPKQHYSIIIVPRADSGALAVIVDQPEMASRVSSLAVLGIVGAAMLLGIALWLSSGTAGGQARAFANLLAELDAGTVSSVKLPSELREIGARIEQLHRDIDSANARAMHCENSLSHEVQRQTKAVKHELHSVIRDADTDALTGLANRRAFKRELPQRFETQHQTGAHLAMMVIDINHFKNFNDTHGHQAGDELLQTIAQLIQANTRRGNEHAFRFGGDEFILLLENTTAAQAVALGERLAAMLAQQIRTLPPTDPPVGMSSGVAELKQHKPHDHAQLMKMADAAMYYAKRKQAACMTIDSALSERRAGVKLPPRVGRR